MEIHLFSHYLLKRLLTSHWSGLRIPLGSQLTTHVYTLLNWQLNSSVYLTLCSDHSVNFEITMYDSFSLNPFQKFYMLYSIFIPYGIGILLPHCLPLQRPWDLRGWSLKMRRTKVSSNSQLYSEHQTIITLRVKRSHVNKVYNDKGKPHVTRTYFSIEWYKQTTISSYHEQSKANSLLSSTPRRSMKA